MSKELRDELERVQVSQRELQVTNSRLLSVISSLTQERDSLVAERKMFQRIDPTDVHVYDTNLFRYGPVPSRNEYLKAILPHKHVVPTNDFVQRLLRGLE